MSEKQLKRLGFVHQGASYAYSYTGTAEKLYKTARSFAPTFVEPTLAQVEDRVVAITAPVVAQAQDLSEKALHIADDQVDCILNTTDKAVADGKKGVVDCMNGVKEMHEKNMQTYIATSNSYFEYIKGISDWAKDKLNPIKGGQHALDTLNAAIAKAQEATDPDVAAKMALDAWNSFASVPVVAKVLETADPVTQTGLSSFYKLHDTLVSWPLYSKVVSTGVSTLSWATTTMPYKLGAQYMYPLVQPVADPALAKITNSKVINGTLSYWKPTASAA
ncbi:oil globule associated protein [Haematococcus lacustris]|uniref:Oil globule associated protein n=1 Tax=Haematococcus lacustris TaxID=44745 RepID=E2JF04_HAELA|nr:oil globule associated protein [Haematococcus lacustris]KAJ9531006.1 hypothetical protein QJQ45_000995 [Haematococcus lacustris]